MLRIVLIRPAATPYDEQGRIQGVLDVPLSDQGNSEAARVAQELVGNFVLDAIYVSPCARAQQTADAIGAALDLRPKTMDNLRNLDHGLWQGMLVEDVKHKQPKLYRQWQEQPDVVCPPDGEMLREARQRVEKILEKLLKKHRDGTVGLVVPEPLASLVRSNLNRQQLGDLWQAGASHGTWEVIEVEPQRAVLSGQ